MNASTRRRFDELLEEVLAELPASIRELIDRVPLHVEDYPSPEMMARLGVRRRDQLCGLFTGIPLTDRSVELSGNLPDVVTIYREGITAAARDEYGRLNSGRLREEIRITVLHELAHYHGMGEEELRQMGYG